MRLYAATGNRAMAQAQFRSYQELLDRDLGIEPDPETKALAEVIATQMAVSVAAIVIAELAQAEVQVWKTLVYEIIIMQNGTRAAIGQFPSM